MPSTETRLGRILQRPPLTPVLRKCLTLLPDHRITVSTFRVFATQGEAIANHDATCRIIILRWYWTELA